MNVYNFNRYYDDALDMISEKRMEDLLSVDLRTHRWMHSLTADRTFEAQMVTPGKQWYILIGQGAFFLGKP